MEEAIAAATSNDVITLTSNVALNKTLNINKTVNINLNNHTIESEEKVFLIHGGSLRLSGNGKVLESKPNYGAIVLLGSDDPTKKEFSTVTVGKGITLQGWSGIFINQYNKTGYGITVNMNGTINAISDTNGSPGAGIYVNGSIKNVDNSPIINLTETTKINSNGVGIYAAGYATYNINGANISGTQSGLGIKSGIFNILDGTISGTGEDETPTEGNNNGINPSGVAIQIESNTNYKGDIELYIKDGIFNSKNSNVIYEYTVNNTGTKVKDINITGGTFTSNTNKQVFYLSDSFKINHQGFISGGQYSSDPTSYLKSGYSTSKNDKSLYTVINNTSVFHETNIEKNNKSFVLIIIMALSIILGSIIFINRKNNIINFIKK